MQPMVLLLEYFNLQIHQIQQIQQIPQLQILQRTQLIQQINLHVIILLCLFKVTQYIMEDSSFKELI